MTQIYLISPEKIELKNFSKSLESALKTGLAPVFQLRLKGYENSEILKIAKELKKICDDFKTAFILNDSFELALEAGADGVHLGENDGLVLKARQNSSQNFIIGASCYDSRHLAIEAAEQGANYVSFGTFFPSVTKNSKGKPTTEIVQWCNEMIDLPIVTIGGINDKNCISLVDAGADFLAVISFVWNHPQGEKAALESLNLAISNVKK